MEGTIINSFAVIAGAGIGLFFNRKLPERIIKITFQGLGLFNLFLGISMALKTQNILLMIVSIVLGGIIGESLNLELRFTKLSDKLKNKFKSNNQKFTEGIVTTFLLFCVGPMTILGSIEDGLGNPPNLLMAKSVLDGISSIALAASLGLGVLIAVIPLFIFQGGITIFATFLDQYLSKSIIHEMEGIGGLLLLGLGISILKIKKIKVFNLLPSLLVVVILALILEQVNFDLF